VSPEAGSVLGRVGLEDDEQVVGRSEDIGRYFAAAVRPDYWRLVVGAVVHCHRVVACRLRQRLFQLKTLETQQNVLPTTVNRDGSLLYCYTSLKSFFLCSSKENQQR